MRKINKKPILSYLFLFILIFIISFVIVGCSKSSDANSTVYPSQRVIAPREEELLVHFIDVGQADSILIQQGNEFMLIDGGNNADSDLVVDYLVNQGVCDLKYVIGTHPHEDHIGGLDAVIDSFNVETVMMPRVTHNTKTFEDVLQSIKNKGLKITSPKVGDTYSIGLGQWTVMAPNNTEYKNLNNYSIVISYSFGNHTFLFMGDAEEQSEVEILGENIKTIQNLQVNVIKVGHHGSKTSTTDDFLNAVNPQYAVITAGHNNKYGHPHTEILDKLDKKNIKILRTDTNGNIIFTSDGFKLNYGSNKND